MKMRNVLFQFSGRIGKRDLWMKGLMFQFTGLLVLFSLVLQTRETAETARIRENAADAKIAKLQRELEEILTAPPHAALNRRDSSDRIDVAQLERKIRLEREARDNRRLPAVGFLVLPLLCLLIWTSLAIAVKRWHDLGHSGWNHLLVLVPIIGLIPAAILLFKTGQPEENEYGPAPDR